MTQCDRVLNYMREFGSITQAEAYLDLGIYRLASRISDLKKAGYPIVSVTEFGKNRYGETTKYSRYSLGG